MRNDPHVQGGIRLQKVLSQAGIASRRAAEELIREGRVSVDGHVVTAMGTRVDPGHQVIHVDGDLVITDESKHIVMALNKPVGMVSTMDDPEGRPCLTDIIGDYPERLYHVGRLDIDTSGLLLLTNDGELANRLTHPSYEVPKTYVARVHGEVKPQVRKQLLKGIELEDGPIAVDGFRVLKPSATSRLLRSACTRGATVWCVDSWMRSASQCANWYAPSSALFASSACNQARRAA